MKKDPFVLQNLPFRLTFSPYRSAASAGETAALMVSILFIKSLL